MLLGWTACWKPGRCRLPKGHDGPCGFLSGDPEIDRLEKENKDLRARIAELEKVKPD